MNIQLIKNINWNLKDIVLHTKVMLFTYLLKAHSLLLFVCMMTTCFWACRVPSSKVPRAGKALLMKEPCRPRNKLSSYTRITKANEPSISRLSQYKNFIFGGSVLFRMSTTLRKVTAISDHR